MMSFVAFVNDFAVCILNVLNSECVEYSVSNIFGFKLGKDK